MPSYVELLERSNVLKFKRDKVEDTSRTSRTLKGFIREVLDEKDLKIKGITSLREIGIEDIESADLSDMISEEIGIYVSDQEIWKCDVYEDLLELVMDKVEGTVSEEAEDWN